ncbi:uncharacterized protein LOC101858895 [Aplysia californica]|uniref:Uncharacterized protein LOC101858895 n=1 Tax=Aplysia californica TaxID=6500 RepID=A0ABM0K4U2_APLCA|nr:uncharacterized protein LOC101858895 [Aplysia californica]
MGATRKDPLACETKTCCGRPVDRHWCSTYSCHYSRNFRPGITWKIYDRLQRRQRGEREARREHQRVARILGQRDALITERHSSALQKNIVDQFQPNASCHAHEQGPAHLSFNDFAILPEQQADDVRRIEQAQRRNQDPQEEKLHALQAQEAVADHLRTPIAGREECKKIHWSQQHQKSQEAKYRRFQQEYQEKFGKSFQAHGSRCGSDELPSCRPVCQTGQLQVLETRPPRDILQPRPIMLKSSHWKGVRVPSCRPEFEPIYPSDVDLDLLSASHNPFQYFNRTRKFPEQANRPASLPVLPKDLDRQCPEQIGTFESTTDSRMPDHRIAQRRHPAYNEITRIW